MLLATDYLAYLNNEIKPNAASNYCYKLSHILILFALRSANKGEVERVLQDLDSYDAAVDDIVDVTFEDVGWVDEMIVSIGCCFPEGTLWGLYKKEVVNNINRNIGANLLPRK